VPDPQPAPLEPLLTQEDVARIARVTPATAKYWRATSTGPDFIRVGRHVRYCMSDVQAWLDGQRVRRVSEDVPA
jgi:hypothetical protein